MRFPLPSDAEAIAHARDIVRRAALDMDPQVVEDAVLLTSEIVTNAVCHGGSRLHLEVERESDHLTVSVGDDGDPFAPGNAPPPPPEVSSGRGLRMVERVAGAWGVRDEENGPGKTVWFRLDDTGHTPQEPGRTTSLPTMESN